MIRAVEPYAYKRVAYEFEDVLYPQAWLPCTRVSLMCTALCAAPVAPTGTPQAPPRCHVSLTSPSNCPKRSAFCCPTCKRPHVHAELRATYSNSHLSSPAPPCSIPFRCLQGFAFRHLGPPPNCTLSEWPNSSAQVVLGLPRAACSAPRWGPECLHGRTPLACRGRVPHMTKRAT